MSGRTGAVLAGFIGVASIAVALTWLEYDRAGALAAGTRFASIVVVVIALVLGAWVVQLVLTRAHVREATELRPGVEVLAVGSARDDDFGMSKVALLAEEDALELVELPSGRWSESIPVGELARWGITRADSNLDWSTTITLAATPDREWLLELDGWRVLPRRVLRRRAERVIRRLDAIAGARGRHAPGIEEQVRLNELPRQLQVGLCRAGPAAGLYILMTPAKSTGWGRPREVWEVSFSATVQLEGETVVDSLFLDPALASDTALIESADISWADPEEHEALLAVAFPWYAA